MQTERTAAYNRRLAQWRMTWLIEHSTSHQLLWCIDSFVLRNPPLRQAPKRYRAFQNDTQKMKFKNYKSAIHNFAHSFMSIDYMKSERLAVNVLIDLYNLKLEPKATFDFINRNILPTEAMTKESNELLKDYMSWLPDHFKAHNCDLTKLEIFEITIWTDFDKAITPPGMSNCKEFVVRTKTKWKADERDEETIEISQTEIIKENFIKLRIPEFK